MRFCGAVGYARTHETSPGVWEDSIVERVYRGDVIKNSRRWTNNPDGVNDNLTVSNTISVVADDMMYYHFAEIRYVCWMGYKWRVTNIEIERPRITLTLGEVYNG